jgi:predicted RNA binding protein YcfA (HicA-like mRNA interferase family)
MKLPRNLSGSDLEKALRRAFGYEFTRQVGSHRRLTTEVGGEHHITLPTHDPLKPGTLRALLGEVMSHHHLRLEELLERLGVR